MRQVRLGETGQFGQGPSHSWLVGGLEYRPYIANYTLKSINHFDTNPQPRSQEVGILSTVHARV